jgi:uncharacterized membrane protein
MRPDRPRKTPASITTASGERVTGNLPPRPPSLAPKDAAATLAPTTTTEPPSITLAGRRLSSPEFNTAMVHFHRAEIQRSNTWRNRLDTTTNWAVLTAGATLSFAFTAPNNPHFVILINTILVAFFLTMEARRYRYYEIWASRVRVIETGFFAQMLKPSSPNDEWADHLAQDLRTPHFTISLWEAMGRRLRRNYLWIFILLAASWNLKVYLHPFPATSLDVFVSRAAVGVIPGDVVFLVGIIFNVGVVVFAFATVQLKQATGEVLPTHEFHPFRSVSNTVSKVAASPRAARASRDSARARSASARRPASGSASTRTRRRNTTPNRWKKNH